MKRDCLVLVLNLDSTSGFPRRSFQKVPGGLSDLAAAISIGNQKNVLRLVLENAAIENDCGRIRYIRAQLPILAFREERFHSKGRAPVMIRGWIVSVAQPRCDG